MKYIYQFIFLLILSQTALAQFTIHVLNPWRDDTCAAWKTSLRMCGNAEVNYHPGTEMVSEGGGWFYYIYNEEKKTGNAKFEIVTWIGPEDWRGKVKYGMAVSIREVFAKVASDIDEVWVVLNPDEVSFPAVYDKPPKGKAIHILNPWPENSPMLIVNKNIPVQMRLKEDMCGWYTYFYAGPADSLTNVTFTDYYKTQKYTASGLANGDGIDLSNILSNYDTVYIQPKPFPHGIPSLTKIFPNRFGDCNTRKVSGLFRDWKLDNVSFFNNPMGASSGHKNMVRKVLLAPEYKPRLTDDPSANTLNSTKLETWFQTFTFPDGKKNDTCVDLIMTKGYDGRWTFDSDNMGGFFPIDNFNNPNNIKYLDNIDPSKPNTKMHNFHFTMEMHLQFVYNEGRKLEFIFQGDDDVWIFVNNRLAIDLGGLQERAKETLFLDQKKAELQIVDGQMYNMDIFFAERNPVGSNFLIRTTMDLRNSGELYYKDTSKGTGITQYDIWQQVQTEAIDCGLTKLTDGEELSRVDFFIEGPSFTNAKELPPGLHYNGINVDANKYRVTIDSTKISGLIPGCYKLTFISTNNKDRTGFLTFVVPPVPDHLDLIPESAPLDLKSDSKVDTVFMGEEQDSIELYAVIRDIYGTYIEDGKNLSWKSSDEKILTVSPSGSDPAKAMVKKVDGGTTWIIVTHNGGLKPDSLKITAVPKPVWPLVSLAIMKDNDGNLVPDFLDIALSDTFKVGQKLLSVNISYKDKQYSIPADSCKISVKSLIVPFTSETGIDGRPTGTVTLIIDVEGKQRTPKGNILDGVGPALISAELLEKASDEPDILYLTFSEPVDKSKLKGDQLLLITDGTTDTIVLNIVDMEKDINDSTFALVFKTSSKMPVPGDKLRLAPGELGGIISDSKNNLPHLLNIPVVIKLKKGAVPIDKAWYKDVNADGLLDVLYLKFNRSIELAELDTTTIQWNGILHKIESSKVSKAGDSIITVPISQTIVGTEIATSGAMFISQKYANLSKTRSATAEDSAAPVIISAKLFLGGYNENGLKELDTLKIKFSESTISTNENPFFFKSKNKSEKYQFHTISKDVNGIQCTFYIDTSTSTPLNGDSIWINENAGLCDKSGMLQQNPLNRRALLEVVPPPVIWMERVGPNPWTGKKPNSNENIPMKIMVISKKKIPDLSLYKANIKIFDGVGNFIKEEKSLKTISNSGFIYEWDGTNNKGRTVGDGTYAAFLTVYQDGTRIWDCKLKLGVKLGEKK